MKIQSKTMKRNLIIGFGAILVIPICINFLLQCSTPNACNIVGTSIDWLNFMGAYIGGIVTALVSFYILFTTIQHNKKEAEINRMNDQLNRLREDLAERMGDFNFCQIMNIIPKLKHNPNINDEIDYLNNLNDIYSRKRFHAKFLYDDSTDNLLAKKFYDAYESYTKELCKGINEITYILSETKNVNAMFLEALNEIIQKKISLTDDTYKDLINSASNYYYSEKKKLDDLIRE